MIKFFWFQTLDPDPKNLGPENLDAEKPGPWKTSTPTF